MIARAAAFLVLWLVLAGFAWGDLPAIVLAVGGATWASRKLLPPGERRLSLAGLGMMALRFPYQSAVAGVDVAVRALAPRMRLKPGFVTVRLPSLHGIARDGFTAFASLMPGTLPVESDAQGALLVHCLDIDQPVAAHMARDAARFARAIRDV